MPYSQELGMRVYDPSEGYNRGLQLGQFASRGMASAMDERKMKMAEQEAALRRQMHMERAVAIEAMNKEIRQEMATNPSQNEEELRIKKISKYAPDLFGPEGAMSFYSQAPYRIAQARAANALATSRERELVTPKVTGQAATVQGLLQLQREAEAAGDKEAAAAYAKALEKTTNIQGQIIRQNADGSFEVISGPMAAGDALTRTNQSKVQESQAQALETIDVTNRLEPLISTETVGIQAFAESWVKDRILAQKFPELASSTRASAEQLAARLRASAVKELRSDSNITEGERQQIMDAIPEINSPINSPKRAKELVKAMRRMAAIRAMVATKRLGGSVPRIAAVALDDSTLLDLAKQGLITKEQARQAWEAKHSNPE